MNYSANMPDWHQYNPSQSGINDITSTAQNVNSGHFSFISSISPTQLNSLNLNSEGHEKHQTDPNYNSRHFQPHLSANISHGHNAADNAPALTSMVQMQNCIGHYGPSSTRNPMVDNLSGSMDPRNTALGNLNEELGYRNNQVPLNGPISHLNGPNVMNMNVPHGSIGPRSTNMNSHTANRTGPPSFVPCKGLCCNPDPNINYQQWEKYCAYQNNTAYRENIRSSAYQTDTRRFGNDLNFRKDNFDGKEVSPSIVPNAPTVDHRRNFPDFKYRKDRLLSRSYPPATGMLQNYPMQNYNYTGEYQKYPYNVKEYSKMSMPNQGMVKHQELGFMAQQKYNNKQAQYQNNAMMSSSMPSANVNPNMIPSTQNAYCFNPQYSRNLSTENSHDCQETADNASIVNRMQTSTTAHAPHARYQMYQQKIAMQKFSMENHLKEMTRIPGYQSHPKYKECVLRYREILKLQQSVTCQGQIQQTPCVTASTVNTSVPPINLRFDQNGVLINSNYMPEAFPRVQQALNSQAPVDNLDKQSKQEHNNVPEMTSVHKPEQLASQQHDNHTTVLCSESLRKQDRYPVQKDLGQSQFEVQKTSNESFSSTSASTVVQRKISKKFADKPELDVRQFLANWDESEDEDSVSSNMPDIVLSNSTPVVVVGYENVDLSAKTLVDGLDSSKPEEIQSNMITFQNQDKANASAMSAQDCLTISYSAAGNVEIAKDICKPVSKESIVQPGSIIQCISNGPDEVPTIHIVDNLEISNILQVTGGQVAETNLEQQNALTFFHERTEVEASAITLQNDKFKNDTTYEATEAVAEYNADIENLSKEKYIVENTSPPKAVESDTPQTSQTNGQQELPTSSVSTKNNLDSTQDINLKKQSSFTSEESHNPDDISLPDLPTSECTPISTTLNTPIHSDSEESSERVEDLTISTNPIEVIQNSPIISFTQSPMRGEPYDHLNDERTVKNKSDVPNPLGTQYQTEDRFKDDGNNNMLNHDAVIDTFEFSTNIDKNESTVNARDDKECANLNGNASTNNEEASIPDSETKSAEVASVCMILTSGEYELKTVSTDMQSKSTRDYKHLTTERRVYESQTVATRDVQATHKTLQVLSETDAETTFRYNDTVELDKALENITSSIDSAEHDVGNDDMNTSKISSLTTTTTTTTIATTTTTTINDITPRNAKLTVEDSCSTKIAKSDPSMSRGIKQSALNSDRLRENETLADDKFAKENVSEKNANGNRSSKINTNSLKDSRHVSIANRKKSTSSNRMDPPNKKCLSENMAKKHSGTIKHPDEHSDTTREVTAYKAKSCTVEDFKESNISKNESKIIDKDVDNNRERLRLLKEYRRMKYNTPGIGQSQNKNKDIQEASNYKVSKGYPSSSLGEESVPQISDKELCQDTKSKSSGEQERKHTILKTFVSKNVNPDFAIQVTNVNLKLKDDDHQKDLQRTGEEAKNNGSLDAIKIEINVSCTERNTTEKLLHENIKNAVAETIGHLTNSISNGARSNSTNLTEIQCDKMVTCDKTDSLDYERYKRSLPSLIETSIYNDARKNQDNAEMTRYKSEMIEREEGLTNDETSILLVSKKRRSSSLERELINNIHEGNINIESELASGALETSKTEQIKRKSVHRNAERRIVAPNVCLSIEESKISSDNSSYVGRSTFRNVSAQKKERQDAFLCKSARSLQDTVSSRLSAGPSTSSSIADPGSENVSYNNFTHFDYNHFDVAPNENVNTDDKRTDRWKRSKRDDGKFSNFDLYKTPSGYINPNFFSIDESEDLNRVPVYTTKDGKITYSPNPRFTYRELIMEARTKEGHGNMREICFAKSPSFDYYDCSKLRKVFKRNRDVNSTGRRREIDPVDTKPQFAAEHIDYLPNKNITHKNICAKTRNAPHLEFFNDDADKSYTNKSNQQESKENNKRNIMDLSFLEPCKPCNADSESNTKYCKTKIFADNHDYENKYGESSMFESNLFLEPKAPCWEETMESVKSYSSHIDRRNSDNRKELNFSEIFAVQKRSNSFSFLSEEQNSSDGKCNRKTNNNRNMANELILPRTTCSYIDDLCLLQDDDPRCEQSDTISCNEQENRNSDNENIVSATSLDNKFENMHNAPLHNEYEKMQQTRFDKIESNAFISTERKQSFSSKTTEEKLKKVLAKDQNPTSYIEDKETLRGNVTKDDMYVHCLVPLNKDTCDTADANIKQSSAEVMSSPKSSTDSLLNKLKCTETIKKSSTFALNEQTDKISDSAKNGSDFTVGDEVTYQQVSSVPTNCKDKEKVLPTIESDISNGVYFNEANGRNDTCDRENFLVCEGKELIAPQNPSNIVSISQSLDEEKNELKLKTLENKGQTGEIVLKKQENDEVDNFVISKPTVLVDLHAIPMEENIRNMFMNQKHEQNISEFTVIKSIIQGDKKPYLEDEVGINPKNCDNIIDTKLLCVSSSDCGIYAEDQCVLTDMSEHDFTEDDSRVPMEWETSQIQEDAVNRLCSIDESSIDFVGATNSLRSEDNSLLDNLSLSTSVVRKSCVLEAISEIKSKPNESAPVIDSRVVTLCNDENKEQDQISSSGYEKVAYLHATDCNANTKMVPKLVIRKTEVSSKFITKMDSPSVIDNVANKSVLKLNCQPKIPKMIIRNARSRPGTPSIEAVTEKVSAEVNLPDRTLPYTAHNETREELLENDSESSLQGSTGQNKNKIPKMKIKLDENYSSKIIIAEDTAEHCVKRKNIKKTIPKVKIKNSPRSDLPDNSISITDIATSQESKDLGKCEEKIPILKLRKQENNRSSSPEAMRKRQNSSLSEVPSKKCKKLGCEEAEHSTRHSDSRTILAECETKKNPLVCISEKIPKVIIKRTSANAEFKCEFSKGCKSIIAKSAKWQPEVKLERYRILDSMVKDLKTSSSTPISLQIIDKIFANRKDNCRQGKKDSYDFHRLSRSNSTSELLPVKCKQRRMSDYDCRRTSGELKDDVNFSPTRVTDSKDTKMCNMKKDKSSRGYNKSTGEYRKDDKRRSRSRDNNSEADVMISCDKEANQTIIGRLISTNFNHEQVTKTDEDSSSISIKFDQKDSPVKYSNSTNFKNVLKELKATSKLETCFVKLPSLDEVSSTKADSRMDVKECKQRENDPFSSKDNKVMVKKERLSSNCDIGNTCTLQDIALFKDDPASILDNSEDSNSVIKIDSSDESQTTIEILPASPDGSHSESRMIEDGESEQLYPADAIPTQFELELEITDNSNIDLLEASMPKLDPITCYGPRVSNDKNCSDRTSKVGCSNKSESLSRDKNSLRKDEYIEIGISGDERSKSGSKSVDSIEQIPWESSCSKKTNPAAMKESFWCNDSLIKEVLAAKETLKKCLSKTGCESSARNSARPKTAAEKKQGSGFELNNVSEMRSKPSDALKGSCDDVRLATDSISAVDKHKTENIYNTEKSDKKHSKQNESIFVKKKLKPSEKDEGLCSTLILVDSKETTRVDSKKAKDTTRECTTISLKTFRRFGQAASSGKAIRTINSNEKRENIAEQNDATAQLRDIRRKEEMSCKISQISKSIDERSNVSNNTNGIKPKEDNMPILEPEIAVSFDASSDRDNSRSPPVITNQDSGDVNVAESKLVDDKLVILDDKVESNLKDIHKRSEMTITDFVTQLAYHEKATIRHRRYCNLCERWFPTTSRHRRHLAGYQHRHIELTQRRSIHALFMLFTGKPCPRLLPANVVRNDCSVGELTPLQIAVQDVTKCFDHIQQSPKKQNDVDK